MRLCVVQLAPGHGSSTTIAGAIALPGYEISYAAEGWSVQQCKHGPNVSCNDHRQALVALAAKCFPRLPTEVAAQVVAFAFHVGYY